MVGRARGLGLCPEVEKLELKVRGTAGRTYALRCQASDTPESLAEKLCSLTGGKLSGDTGHQHFSYGGRPIQAGSRIGDYIAWDAHEKESCIKWLGAGEAEGDGRVQEIGSDAITGAEGSQRRANASVSDSSNGAAVVDPSLVAEFAGAQAGAVVAPKAAATRAVSPFRGQEIRMISVIRMTGAEIPGAVARDGHD